MNNEKLNAYANQIEATGLKRDAEVTDLHHYVIAVEVTPKDYTEVIESMPDAFEGCFDRFNKNTGKEESVVMFYLEDCTKEDAEAIVNWLKTHTGWQTYEYVG